MYYEDVYNSKHHENRQLESKHPHRCYSPSHIAPDSVATGAFSMFAITETSKS